MKTNDRPFSLRSFLPRILPVFIMIMMLPGLSGIEASEGTQKWRFQAGGSITASPAIGDDGLIYTGAEGSLYAINPDGSQRWRFPAGYAVHSSPTIGEDGTIYVGLWDYFLYAITPGAKQKWRFQANGRITASPAIGKDGVIYIGSSDGNLHARNPDGTEKWRFHTGGGVPSSPAVGKDWRIYTGASNGYIYAIDPDGTEQWRFQTGGSIASSPAIGEDDTIYVTSEDGGLYALDPDGTEKWRFQTGGAVQSSPVIGNGGVVYFGSNDNYLYAIDSSGEETWRFRTGGAVQSSPAIGKNGTVFFGSNDNRLYAVDPDGKEKWRFRAAGAFQSSPAIGRDGTIYAGAADGNLYAIDSDSGGLAAAPWPAFQQNNKRTGLHPFPEFAGTGSLKVTIEPAGAAAAGAQWRRTGTDTWYDSANTEGKVDAGDHTIEISPINGWIAPENIDAAVIEDGITEITAVYTKVLSTYTLIYRAFRGGYIEGDTNQEIAENEDAETVEAVPHSGLYFLEWSDGRTDNPRTDRNITEDMIITAYFESAEGNLGTPGNPFIIRNPAQLSDMRNNLSSYFQLSRDIDMDGVTDWEPIGTEEAPFTGGFYGNGYVIRNLSIEKSDTDAVGLFGYAKNAVIDQAGLQNARITGGNRVGGIAGYAVDTFIDQSFVKGSISGGENVGGLAGYFEATSKAMISDSYAACDLDGETAVGGIVGTLGIDTSIEYTYAVGRVEGRTDIGGIVGRNLDSSHDNVAGSYWDADTGPSMSAGGKGEPSSYLKWKETFPDWAFDDVWGIDEGITRPYLRWEDKINPPQEDTVSTTCFIGAVLLGSDHTK